MNKIKNIVIVFFALSVLLIVIAGYGSFNLGRNIRFYANYRKIQPEMASIQNSVEKLPAVDLSKFKTEVESSKYSQTQLTSSVSQELSGFGMAVMDVSLRSSAGSDNVIRISVKGVVPVDKLNDFLLGVSSIKKFFFVEKMDVSPRISSVQLADRFEKIKGDPRQIEALVKDAEKVSDLKSFMIEMEALAVTN